jgi:hypothetical protein
MRPVLRFSMLLLVAGCGWSQAFTDAAAVVAGGSVGAGAGKKVSEGIANVLNKVDAATAKAAKTEKDFKQRPADKPIAAKTSQKAADGGLGNGNGGGAVLKVGPGGVVKDHSLVPPPPAKRVVAVVPPPPALVPQTPLALAPVVVLPPAPQVTAEDLKKIAGGAPRAEVLKFGEPASRITMFDDGHLVEIYRYQTRETTFGVVRLSDGTVSSIQVR